MTGGTIMKPVRRTPKFDRDKWKEALKEMREKLAATRGDAVDDVDDLPDSLPLDGTTVIFLGPGKKRRQEPTTS